MTGWIAKLNWPALCGACIGQSVQASSPFAGCSNRCGSAALLPEVFRTKLRYKMWESQSPHQRKALAARVFHFNCNATAPAIPYLDIHSAVQALIPGILRHRSVRCRETLATRVFRRSCYKSASLLFDTIVLTFPLVIAPDTVDAACELDLLNSGHFAGLGFKSDTDQLQRCALSIQLFQRARMYIHSSLVGVKSGNEDFNCQPHSYIQCNHVRSISFSCRMFCIEALLPPSRGRRKWLRD
jgi:hypothetical protein